MFQANIILHDSYFDTVFHWEFYTTAFHSNWAFKFLIDVHPITRNGKTIFRLINSNE